MRPTTNLAAETVIRYGAQEAIDADLLALLGIRVAPGITLHGLLGNYGDGGIQQVRVDALLELIRRVTRSQERPRLTSPCSAWNYLQTRAATWGEEHFGLLALNAKGELLAERILSQGTATGTLISPREFFREALRYGATTALAFHNHPSGDPTPSQEDIALTHRLRAAGESLGVLLADHLILGRDSYHSFRAAEGWGRR